MKDGIEQLIGGYKDAITVQRVFGEPYQQNGVTVIPAASVMGGGGGGEGETPEGGTTSIGRGSGFGLVGRPAGAYVIRGDQVTWLPAIDVNRIVGWVLALTALRLLLRRKRAR